LLQNFSDSGPERHMASIIWSVFVLLLVFAAIADSRTYRIPNWISLGLVGLFLVAALASGEPLVGFWPHAALGAGVLVLGYALFALTGMGAGDAKLAAAATLWAGFGGLYTWTFALALSMAALALGLVALRRIGPLAAVASRMRMLQRGAPVPLGVALSAATILASWEFNPVLWAF
jgi:prepilin peptidase CpaA